MLSEDMLNRRGSYGRYVTVGDAHKKKTRGTQRIQPTIGIGRRHRTPTSGHNSDGAPLTRIYGRTSRRTLDQVNRAPLSS